MYTTIKIVVEPDGYTVVTKRRNGRADAVFFDSLEEASAYRDAEAERIGATPLYWNNRIAAYVTVPKD